MSVRKGATRNERDEGEILFQHPSYTLFSVSKKTVSSAEKTKSGQVFYKDGKKTETNRYVSTGTILVTFDEKSHVDLKEFAEANHLKYIKTVSKVGHNIVLFANQSDKNDIVLSSELNKRSGVSVAKPNWIVPIKLF